MATHSNILPGEFHGQRSLAGYIPQDKEEPDTLEGLTLCKKKFFLTSQVIMTYRNLTFGRFNTMYIQRNI